MNEQISFIIPYVFVNIMKGIDEELYLLNEDSNNLVPIIIAKSNETIL